MRKALTALGIMAIPLAAIADQNPFLPPEARQTVAPVSMPVMTGPGGQVIHQPAAVSAQDQKSNSLQGAKMIAIINGEEVWYKPEEGIYVRFPASSTSKSTLESQAQAPDVEAIEQKIADVQQAAQKPNRQAKTW